MQSVSNEFLRVARSSVREVSGRVLMSFDKTFDDNVDFFTLDTSELDGTDILAGQNDVIQEWDKYVYKNYTDRVISIEWEREERVPSSFVQAMADVVFDNSDDYFTPGSGSEIDGDILPGRPIRLYAGFKHEQVPVFVGLTEGLPVIDDKRKTASFHCTDFITWIFKRKLQQSVMYTESRISDVLDGLLQECGLLPTQYELDVSLYKVEYAYFEKDTTLGSAIEDLMEAEMGSFFLDETGVLRFKNRTNYDITEVEEFDEDNTLELSTRKLTDIINRAEITSEVLEIQPNDVIYRLGAPFEIAPGATVEDFYEFDSPAVTVDNVIVTANTAIDGSGTDMTADVDVVSQDDFSKASKIVLENTSGVNVYIIEMIINGEAVIPIEPIFVEQQDDVSVAAFEEQVKEINNKFIQRQDQAESLAAALLIGYSSLLAVQKTEVKGHPALQLSDQVAVNLNTDETEYAISKIACSIIAGKFAQHLQFRVRPTTEFFKLDEDVLDGPAVLSY